MAVPPETESLDPGAEVPIPTSPAPPAIEKLFDPKVNVVFCVNAPPSVTVFEADVNPFVNEIALK